MNRENSPPVGTPELDEDGKTLLEVLHAEEEMRESVANDAGPYLEKISNLTAMQDAKNTPYSTSTDKP